MTSSKTYTYSPRHRALEVASIGLFFLLLAGIGWRVGSATTNVGGVIAIATAVFLGFLAADVISGLAHWAGDTVGDETWPFVGKNFIHHFRQHHVDPRDITRHDFIETNGNNCITSVPILAAALWLTPDHEGAGLFTSTLLATTALAVFGTNQFHKWAHAGDDTPRYAKVLQRWGLILRPSHHDVHHTVPHDKYYCITVGWMNPVLTKIRFFRAAEWLIARVNPKLLHLEERIAHTAS